MIHKHTRNCSGKKEKQEEKQQQEKTLLPSDLNRRLELCLEPPNLKCLEARNSERKLSFPLIFLYNFFIVTVRFRESRKIWKIRPLSYFPRMGLKFGFLKENSIIL